MRQTLRKHRWRLRRPRVVGAELGDQHLVTPEELRLRLLVAAERRQALAVVALEGRGDPGAGPPRLLRHGDGAPVDILPEMCSRFAIDMQLAASDNLPKDVDGNIELKCTLPDGRTIIAQAEFDQCG